MPTYLSPRKYHQVSAMKFTSLTTVITTAAAMAGVVIASSDELPNFACVPNQGGCSAGIGNYNNGNAFGYICGPDGNIDGWFPCSCNTRYCCVVDEQPDGHLTPYCVP
ncbi:hypothetical protein F4604DRAFT_1824782 [Suillus subluteus]|nr:hypothetical protein F4604DRAFT_1824782 [Suillus subluteus]